MSLSNKHKLLFVIGLNVVLAFFVVFSYPQITEARISLPRGDEVVENSSSLDAFGFSMMLANNSIATSTVLVDQSDVTNFKHWNTGAVEIFKLRFDWQTNGTASTTLRIGVIASSTPAGNLTDIYWFDSIGFATAVDGSKNQRQSVEISYLPGSFSTRVASGVPSGFITSYADTSSSKYATTTKYWSPRGAYTANPGVGDLVMEVYSQTGAATTSVHGLYRVTE